MKMKPYFVIILISIFLSNPYFSLSQERYLEVSFTDVKVTDSVIYSTNFSVFPMQDTVLASQYLDIYEPVGDSITERPLILFAISGLFFPSFYSNGYPFGERWDSANVEIATRLAKRGFVVAVVQYRRGWIGVTIPYNPQRTSSYLHANYRGIQDMNTAVRYFKANKTQWKIDTTRIAVGGHGVGGSIAYGAAYLDRYEETLIPKFIDFTDPNNPIPFLDTLLMGDPEGIKPAQINRSNHEHHTSDFRAGFALGGALGDSSWVEAGDIPFVAMHTYRDPVIPYYVGDIMDNKMLIPDASGGKAVISRSDRLGNQDIFKGIQWNDPFNSAAANNVYNDGAEGLYTFITPFSPGDAMCRDFWRDSDSLIEWSAPWRWFDSLTYVNLWNASNVPDTNYGPQPAGGEYMYCIHTRGAPNEKRYALNYIDTIIGFLAPRLYVSMDLINPFEVNSEEPNIHIYPNPSRLDIYIRYTGVATKSIPSIRMMDVSGRIVRSYANINSNRSRIERGNLASGIYILQIKVGDQYINKKVVFH